MIELQIGELPHKNRLRRLITGHGRQYLFHVEDSEPVIVARVHRADMFMEFLKQQSEQMAKALHAYYDLKNGGVRAKEGVRHVTGPYGHSGRS